MSFKRAKSASSGRSGFTMVELLVVMALIVVLVAILLPALFAAAGQGARAQSEANLRQIGQWLAQYQSEFRQTIVPSRFDYTGSSVPGKAKSENPNISERYRGTWTDILWARYLHTPFPDAESWAQHDYEFDSPDSTFYDHYPNFDGNPFRSAERNTRGEQGHPGYFAANDFFSAIPSLQYPDGKWWSIAQIKDPGSSLYCIDSWAGEFITPLPNIWGRDVNNTSQVPEVDYRYQGDALILLLDGHVSSLGEVIVETGGTTDLDIIQNERRIKVQRLDSRY